MEQIYKTIGIDVTHHVLNNHYPVNEKENDESIRSYCDNRGIVYHDLKENVGLSSGYEYLMRQAAPFADEIVILADPDVYPITEGWGRALLSVASDPRVGIASLMFSTVKREMIERGYDELSVSGHRVWRGHQACMNSICAMRRSRLEFIGGLQEPKKYYGGAEGSLAPRLKKANWDWVYLADYWEQYHESVASEPIYREYKIEYALMNSTNLSFKDWLKQKGKL